MERDTALLLQAVDAVHDATDLNAALLALVDVLRDRFELWYASFATVPTGSTQVQLLATWSLAETHFDPGTEISTTISATAEETMQQLREGRAVLLGTSDAGSLLGYLLSQQGVASLLTLPVHSDESSMLLLGFGSSSKESLRTAIPGFYEGLAAGIKEKVLRLANSPTA
jgi:hypothetical protein